MMIELVTASLSDQMTLDEVVNVLKTSPQVDGIAQFGSRAVNQANPASDYDLLVLVTDLPAPVFQLVTTIDGRLADTVLVDIALADRLLTEGAAASQEQFDWLFLQKMRTASVLLDCNRRLAGVQRLSQSLSIQAPLGLPEAEEAYQTWFWQGFGLLHLQRMTLSIDPVQQVAADMMLLSCLVGTWRSYFALRRIAWEGEKAAIRYWLQYDITCYTLLQAVLTSADRVARLKAYQQLVRHVLAPVGPVMQKGQTAVILTAMNNDNAVHSVLAYWNGLLV